MRNPLFTVNAIPINKHKNWKVLMQSSSTGTLTLGNGGRSDAGTGTASYDLLIKVGTGGWERYTGQGVDFNSTFTIGGLAPNTVYPVEIAPLIRSYGWSRAITFSKSKQILEVLQFPSVDAYAISADNLGNHFLNGIFFQCSNLVAVRDWFEWGEGITTIGTYLYSSLFQECTSLTLIPEVITAPLAESQGTNCLYRTFYGCSSLVKCTLGTYRGVSGMMTQTFYNCTALEEVDLGTVIDPNGRGGSATFTNCPNLKLLYLHAFSGASSYGGGMFTNSGIGDNQLEIVILGESGKEGYPLDYLANSCNLTNAQVKSVSVEPELYFRYLNYTASERPGRYVPIWADIDDWKFKMIGATLPNEYEEIQWIGTGDATAYIKWNKIPSANATTIRTRTRIVSTDFSTRQFFFGIGSSGVVQYAEYKNGVLRALAQNDTGGMNATLNRRYNVEMVFNRGDVDNCILNVDGAVATTTTKLQTKAYTPNMFLKLSGNYYGKYLRAGIYQQFVEEGGESTLSINAVPCKRKADTVYGWYDLVSATFYPSAGNAFPESSDRA